MNVFIDSPENKKNIFLITGSNCLKHVLHTHVFLLAMFVFHLYICPAQFKVEGFSELRSRPCTLLRFSRWSPRFPSVAPRLELSSHRIFLTLFRSHRGRALATRRTSLSFRRVFSTNIFSNEAGDQILYYSENMFYKIYFFNNTFL